jgi:metallo-beta-lactamase family protein
MSLGIQFLGGAGTVTGSKYLLSHGKHSVLIDCGLFQGLKTLRMQNWDYLPVEPSKISAIILTHAHIDHSGYIPRLIKNGFRGKIFCTPATKELCKILLPDCGYLMEEEAEFLTRKMKTKHSPALPLFSEQEAKASLEYFDTVPFNERKFLESDFTFEFLYAGHILGAASIIVTVAGKKIAFSGDIGRQNDKIFYPPAPLPPVDYLITESTYGNRLHKETDILDELAEVVNETYQRRGVVLIPSFAVGRAQALMYYLSVLKKDKRIPDFPMFLNSPMATSVDDVFCSFNKLHRLSEADCIRSCQAVKYVRSVEESKRLNEKSGPMLIISASGMLTGGRVLHHLKAFAGDEKNTILLTGYQAAGTRGEALERGAQEIKVHGEYIPVRAQVKTLSNMSAHADYKEIIQWLSLSKISPKEVFITHGEASAADELRRRLGESFGWHCSVPQQNQKFSLN